MAHVFGCCDVPLCSHNVIVEHQVRIQMGFIPE